MKPNRLRNWLKEQPITAGQFADALGIHRVTLARYTSGSRLPDPDTCRKIEAATGGGVTPAMLHADYIA